jgi:uncharacterized membrane protein
LTAVCLVAAILIREDISIDLFFVGMFLIISGFRARLGLLIAGTSLTTFVLIRFVIMPLAGKFYLPSLIYGGLVISGDSGFGSVIKSVLTNPVYFVSTLVREDKLTYALHIFGPLLLLPLRSYKTAILCAGGIFFTFLTTDYGPTVSIRFQYPSHWIPYVFAATAIALSTYATKQQGELRRNATLIAVAAGIVLHSYVFGALLQRDTYIGGFYRVAFSMTQEEQRRYEDLRAMVALIPQQASVAADERLVPHVSSRLTVYTLRTEHGDADYILLDKNSVQPKQRVMYQQLANEGNYKLRDRRGDLFLFARGAEGTDATEAFRELGVKASKVVR